MRSVETRAERGARLVVSYALQPQRCAAPKFVQRGVTVQKHSQRCVRFTACLEDLRATIVSRARLCESLALPRRDSVSTRRSLAEAILRFGTGSGATGLNRAGASRGASRGPAFVRGVRDARCPSTYFSTCRGPAQWPPAAGPRSGAPRRPRIAESPTTPSSSLGRPDG